MVRMGLIHPLQPPMDTVLPGVFWDPLPFAVYPTLAPEGRQGHGSSPGTRSLIAGPSFGEIGLKTRRAAVFAPNLPGTCRPLRAGAQSAAPPSAWAANPGQERCRAGGTGSAAGCGVSKLGMNQGRAVRAPGPCTAPGCLC